MAIPVLGKLSGLLLAATLTTAVGAADSTVYRHRDASGAVSYSDSAVGPTGSDTEPLPPTPVTTIASPPGRSDGGATDDNNADDGVGRYQRLVILSPGDQQSVRSNSGALTVEIGISPPLRRGDTVVITLDGGPRAQISAPDRSATIANVDRGQHRIQAILMDESQSILLRSRPTTLFMHRFSALSPP